MGSLDNSRLIDWLIDWSTDCWVFGCLPCFIAPVLFQVLDHCLKPAKPSTPPRCGSWRSICEQLPRCPVKRASVTGPITKSTATFPPPWLPYSLLAQSETGNIQHNHGDFRSINGLSVIFLTETRKTAWCGKPCPAASGTMWRTFWRRVAMWTKWSRKPSLPPWCSPSGTDPRKSSNSSWTTMPMWRGVIKTVRTIHSPSWRQDCRFLTRDNSQPFIFCFKQPFKSLDQHM